MDWHFLMNIGCRDSNSTGASRAKVEQNEHYPQAKCVTQQAYATQGDAAGVQTRTSSNTTHLTWPYPNHPAPRTTTAAIRLGAEQPRNEREGRVGASTT
eukprot:1142772-Amphidinium_carterae.3